jgi:ribonuclease P protein subunit RPR2
MPKNEELVKRVAVERIERLFELAKERTEMKDKASKDLAKRYIRIAKAISSRYKVSMPSSVKNFICKRCSSVLIPGFNCTVRLASSKRYIVYKCECGEEKHVFYK